MVKCHPGRLHGTICYFDPQKRSQKAADVWKKDVWDFQAFSQTFLELRLSLGNEGKDGKNLNSQTWPGIAISLGWYRLQKALKPGNTKKNTKQLQNPSSRVGPKKYEKITEEIRKRPFSDRFRIFSVFFRIFWAQPGMGIL